MAGWEPSPLPEAPPSPPRGLFPPLPTLTTLSPPLLSKRHHNLSVITTNATLVHQKTPSCSRGKCDLGHCSLVRLSVPCGCSRLKSWLPCDCFAPFALNSFLEFPHLFPSWASKYWNRPSGRVPVCDPCPFCLSAPSWEGHCFLMPEPLAFLHPPRP